MLDYDSLLAAQQDGRQLVKSLFDNGEKFFHLPEVGCEQGDFTIAAPEIKKIKIKRENLLAFWADISTTTTACQTLFLAVVAQGGAEALLLSTMTFVERNAPAVVHSLYHACADYRAVVVGTWKGVGGYLYGKDYTLHAFHAVVTQGGSKAFSLQACTTSAATPLLLGEESCTSGIQKPSHSCCCRLAKPFCTTP